MDHETKLLVSVVIGILVLASIAGAVLARASTSELATREER